MTRLHKLALAAFGAAFFIAGQALAQNAGTVSAHAFAIGKGAGTTGYTSLLCGSAQLAVGQSAADPICKTITGDVTISAAGVTAIGAGKVASSMLADTTVTPGSYGSTSVITTFTVNSKGQITAASNATAAIPVGQITGLGTGIATWLATPSSANLASAVTDETGSGKLVFGTSPTLTTPAISSPTGLVKGDVGLGNVDNTSDATKWAATATLTNKTFDTAGTGNSFSINGVAATANTGTGAVVRAASPALTGTPTAPTASPSDNSTKIATTAYVDAQVASGVSGVASIAGNTGAFTLGDGLTNSVNVLKVNAGQVPGTATNDNAAAGFVGEYTSASLVYASRVTLTSATSSNITSLSLTAGDWDITGHIKFEGAGGPTTTSIQAGVSTTSGTLDQSADDLYAYGPGLNSSVVDVSAIVPAVRKSLSATTTIYLVGRAAWTGGTNVKAWGIITARRVR